MNREEQKQQSKQKILEAAQEEFGQHDYYLASTNNMCKSQGISKGLLFHYYKSKDELFMLCVENCFMALSEWIKQEAQTINGNLEDSLTQYIESRMTFFVTYPYQQRIFLMRYLIHLSI